MCVAGSRAKAALLTPAVLPFKKCEENNDTFYLEADQEVNWS